MASFLALCAQESIVVQTVDAAVKKALSESTVQKVPTGNSAQAKDARRELLAAVLWVRHTATGFDDAWQVISPQMQNTLKDLYPLSANVASSPDGWKRAIASALTINVAPPLAAQPQVPQAAQPQTGVPGGPQTSQGRKKTSQPLQAAPAAAVAPHSLSPGPPSAGMSVPPPQGAGSGAGGASVRELWTTQSPFLPPAGYKSPTVQALVAAIPTKRISHFYRESAFEGTAMSQYTKAYTAASTQGGVHPEPMDNPLFVHRCSIRYTGAAQVVPRRDGKALGFMVAWDSRSFYEGQTLEMYDMRIRILSEQWEPVYAALKSEQSVPLSLIDPFLDRIDEMLKKRVAEAEREMEHLGPAAHEIIAGCHRQAEEFSALRRTYAETLKRRIALDVANLRKAALVSNAYYCNLVAPAMSILISGNVDENDVDALVEETICGAQSAKRSKTDGAASKVSVSSVSAQPSSVQIAPTQAYPPAWYGGSVPILPPWAGPPVGYGMPGNPLWGGPPTAQQVVVPYQQAGAPPPSGQGGASGPATGMGSQTAPQLAQLSGSKGAAALLGPPGSGTAGLTGVKQALVCQPGSADVIGSNLAVIQPGRYGIRGFLCKRCAPASHFKFECPKRYAETLLEPCPGFDDQGTRVPGAWYGGQLTQQARDAWKDYIRRHNLVASREASGRTPAF